jgi:PilZ domain-containing protein
MEKRNRDRLVMHSFCRVAPSRNRRRGAWKRIENISGAGMLMEWSRSDQEEPLPRIGDDFIVEMELPAHPVFGQRSLHFRAKVVRVFRNGDGRVMAGLETVQSRFKTPKRQPADESPGTRYIN